jgi:hypothetical protein
MSIHAASRSRIAHRRRANATDLARRSVLRNAHATDFAGRDRTRDFRAEVRDERSAGEDAVWPPASTMSRDARRIDRD